MAAENTPEAVTVAQAAAEVIQEAAADQVIAEDIPEAATRVAVAIAAEEAIPEVAEEAIPAIQGDDSTSNAHKNSCLNRFYEFKI